MIFPAWTWVLPAAAAVLCLVGFYKLSFFTSLARGLSLAGLSLTVLILTLARGEAALPLIVLCLLGLIYGMVRDGLRAVGEMQSAMKRRNMKSRKEREMNPLLPVLKWLCFTLLYTLAIFPIWYRASAEEAGGAVWAWIGAGLMTAGLVIELIARSQMMKAADMNPYMPALTGLFRYTRCPGACGEFLFWTGVFLSGIGVYSGWQWLVAALAYLSSLGLILRRVGVEKRYAEKNFGDLPVYRAYAERTPLLFPFVPLSRTAAGNKEKQTDD